MRCGLNEHVWCVAQLRPRCCPPGTAACAQLPRQHWCAELRLCSPGRTGACGRPLARRREGDITRRRCAVPTRCGARKSGTSCCCHRQGQSPHCPHLSSASAAPPRRSCAAGFSKTTRGQTRSKTSSLACTNFFPLYLWKQYHADLAGDRATKKNRKKNRIAHHRIIINQPCRRSGFFWRMRACLCLACSGHYPVLSGFQQSQSLSLLCCLSLSFCVSRPEVTVTPLHPPRLCRIAVLLVNPIVSLSRRFEVTITVFLIQNQRLSHVRGILIGGVRTVDIPDAGRHDQVRLRGRSRY